MSITGNLNGIDLNISNWEELSFNFQIPLDSVNSTFDTEFLPEFIKERGDSDPIDKITSEIKKRGILSTIPFPLKTHNNLTINGHLIAGAKGNELGGDNPERLKIKWKYGNSDFFERAKGLKMKQFLSRSDFETVRTIRENVPNYLEVVLVGLATAFVVKALIDYINDISKDAANVAVDLTPEPEKSISPAGPTSAGVPSLSKSAARIALNVILQVAYIAALILAIVELLKTMSDNLFQKPRAYYCLNVYDTIVKGCEKLGVSFKSSFFNGAMKDLMLLPQTTRQGTLKVTPANNPIPQTDFLQFLTSISTLFYGRARVTTDGVLRLEPKSYWENLTPTIKKPLEDRYISSTYESNAEDLFKSCKISYANATSDLNYKDESIQVIYEHKTIPEKDLIFQNELEVNIPYQIANRKNSTNDLERFFNSIFDIISGIDARYKVSGDRVGYMLLAEDAVPVDTLFLRAGSEKIKRDSLKTLGAEALYNDFYEPEVTPWNNNKRIYKNIVEQKVFDLNDCVSLSDNSNMYDENGNIVTITQANHNTNTVVSEFTHQRKVINGELGYIDRDDFNILINQKTEE